jgi:hypothetical protein
MEKHICEYCGKEFEREISFNSKGKPRPTRFCSESCKNKRSNEFVKNRYSRPVGSKMAPYKSHKSHQNSVDNHWCCSVCGKEFRVRRDLLNHKREEGHQLNKDWGHINPKGFYTCKFCGREVFTTKGGNTMHEKSCYENPNRVDGCWKGLKHSEDSKRKTRESTIEYLNTIGIKGARWNPKACDFIEYLNKRNSWNLQHALNGGERTVDGYFLDGYDEALNIVFEYDEKRHYANVKLNVLKEKDMLRQNNIIEKLNCEFWRYNEETDCLYKVN